VTWFDRLVILLDRLPTQRLTLLRDIITALVERRRSEENPPFADLESALHAASDAPGGRRVPK
jgi:hypothetical protein